ncbi:MAG: VWA domain-containing protein, partial [Anaerolineales bacterium]|nr:VWA domain-containing protein [Anaerolineales bacterium]
GDLDLGLVDVAADGSWSFDSDLALEPGTYDLQARMHAPDGTDLDTAEIAGLVVPALGTAPTLVIDETDGGLMWRGMAQPNSTVEIVVDGVVVGTATADAAGIWSWAPDLALGAYEVAVRTADNPDLASDAQTVRFGLPVSIGPAEIVDAGDGTAELTLRGTAVANSQIQIIINGEIVDTVTADADGNWAYTTSLPNGSYEVNGRYLDLSEAQADQMAASQTLTIGQPMGTLQLLLAGASGAGQPGTAPAGAPAVEIILDASWSMMELLGDDTRFEAARTSLQNITETVLPDGTPIAVRVFGNIEGDYACRTDLMVPYQPLDREAMASFLADVEPQFNANTPLADSLARVQFDLAEAGDVERIVVLLTDGKETCGGDPAAQIQKLRDLGINVQVNIVGLAIADDALKAEFERWAEIGGGQYFDVSDPARLAEVLGEAILIPYIVRNEAGDIVTYGRVGGLTQNLPVGTYEVEVRTVPAVTFDMVEIAEGELIQLTLDE